VDLDAESRRYAAAAGLLLDAYHPARPGGTGETFDWERIPAGLGQHIILAGGLTPNNIPLAIRSVRPYAVDVSGGVESAPGMKDPDRIERFIRGVQIGDQQDTLG
jgi:phosphoribosylanthranilate isomerase